MGSEEPEIMFSVTIPEGTDIVEAFSELLNPARRRQMMREAEDRRVRALFRDRDHARRVWNEWDGIEPIGEDAHRYLNLIGDGAYCAV